MSKLQSIDETIAKLLKPIFNGSKKEFVLMNNLIKNWEDIVGKKYAKFCSPKAVSFGKNQQSKLVIAAHNSAVGFFLQSNSDLILERIAAFYGFKSLNKIIIKQEPLELDLATKKEIKITEKESEFLKKNLTSIEDQDLAKILEKIAKEIFSEKSKSQKAKH